MSNVFDPPSLPLPSVPPPPHAPAPRPPQFAPERAPHKVAWWRHTWIKVPIWAWIVVALVGASATSAATTNKDDKPTVAAVADDPATTVASTQATLSPTTVAPTTHPATTLPATTLPATTLPPTTPPTTPPPPTMHEAFVSWSISENVLPLLNGVSAAIDPLTEAAGNGDIYGLGVACIGLHDANQELGAALPSPSPEFNVAMQSAIDDYDTAMHHCQTGTATLDPTELGLTGDYLVKGTEHLVVANTILKDI
jgi:hypothetical protein